MEETTTSATGVVATVSRTEVEEAARSSEPIDLLLDVQVEQEGRTDTQRLTLAWEQADLEKLLESTSGDEIQLSFDERELQLLLDGDVEAHGLREKFAVVTAVAGLAAAAAGPATASVYGGNEGGTPAAAQQAVAPAEITTGLTPTAQAGTARATSSEISAGLPQQPTTEGTAAPASEISTGLAPASDSTSSLARASEISTGLTPGTEGTASLARASEISTGLTPGTGSTPSLAAIHVAPAQAVHASEVSTGITPGPTATDTPGGGGTSLEWPSTAELAAGVGALLAITAAMFVARTQRRPPMPA